MKTPGVKTNKIKGGKKSLVYDSSESLEDIFDDANNIKGKKEEEKLVRSQLCSPSAASSSSEVLNKEKLMSEKMPSDHQELEENKSNKKRRSRNLYSKFEQRLLNCVKNARENGIGMSRKIFKNKALEYYKQSGIRRHFEASRQWILRFEKRYNVELKNKKTKLSPRQEPRAYLSRNAKTRKEEMNLMENSEKNENVNRKMRDDLENEAEEIAEREGEYRDSEELKQKAEIEEDNWYDLLISNSDISLGASVEVATGVENEQEKNQEPTEDKDNNKEIDAEGKDLLLPSNTSKEIILGGTENIFFEADDVTVKNIKLAMIEVINTGMEEVFVIEYEEVKNILEKKAEVAVEEQQKSKEVEKEEDGEGKEQVVEEKENKEEEEIENISQQTVEVKISDKNIGTDEEERNQESKGEEDNEEPYEKIEKDKIVESDMKRFEVSENKIAIIVNEVENIENETDKEETKKEMDLNEKGKTIKHTTFATHDEVIDDQYLTDQSSSSSSSSSSVESIKSNNIKEYLRLQSYKLVFSKCKKFLSDRGIKKHFNYKQLKEFRKSMDILINTATSEEDLLDNLLMSQNWAPFGKMWCTEDIARVSKGKIICTWCYEEAEEKYKNYSKSAINHQLTANRNLEGRVCDVCGESTVDFRPAAKCIVCIIPFWRNKSHYRLLFCNEIGNLGMSSKQLNLVCSILSNI